jgi:hypothetical protein
VHQSICGFISTTNSSQNVNSKNGFSVVIGNGKVVPLLNYLSTMPRICMREFLFTSALVGGGWSASWPCRFTPGESAHGTHWIGGWVGDMEKRKSLALLGLEPQPLGRPARSQPPYRLLYCGSFTVTGDNINMIQAHFLKLVTEVNVM